MSVLVLNRNPLGPFPHHEWLRDYPGPVILVADRSRIVKMGEPVPTGPVGHCELVLVDSFDANEDAVRRLLRELADRHGARHVVALSEPDLDLAAELREERDLPGPRAADIAAFRDKLLMKQRAAAAGVTTASYAPARDAAAVRDFARTHGLPVVVKNRSGYNAIGLRIARDAAQLDAALAAAFPDGRTRDDLLVERYVPGRMCHVDGVVIDGRPALAWPSQYQYELATFGSDPGARIDLTLDPGDPLTPRLLDLVDRVLPALAGDGGRMRDHAFHAEVFHTPDDELVLCEVAARPAGAKVRDVVGAMFGVDPAEYAVRSQAGLPLRDLPPGGPDGARPRPRCMGGQVLMMKRPGTVRTLPPPPDEPWVHRYWTFAREGDVIPPAAGSSDFLLAAVATGPDRATCERRLRALGARFEEQAQIVAAA